MITIWKYEIPILREFVLDMPKNAKILTCREQFDKPVLWACVDPKQELEQRKFLLIGTGHFFQDKFECNYIATFQLGEFVGHLFEDLKRDDA